MMTGLVRWGWELNYWKETRPTRSKEDTIGQHSHVADDDDDDNGDDDDDDERWNTGNRLSQVADRKTISSQSYPELSRAQLGRDRRSSPEKIVQGREGRSHR